MPKTPEELAAEAAVAAAATAAAEPQSFEDAFAEATADEKPDTKPVVKTADEVAAEDAAKAKGKEGDDGVTAAAADKTPAAADPAAVAAPAAATAADPAAELAAAKAEIEALKTAAKAAPATTTDDGKGSAAAVATDTTKAPAIEWYKATDDEKAIVDKYVTEWPEEAKAHGIQTKAAVYNAMQYIFTEIAKNYGPVIENFREMSETIEGHLAEQMIRGKNADYDTVRPAVLKWVDTLPTFIKNSAKQVMETGTPDEVSEIIAEYRKQNPTAAAATATAAAASTVATPAAQQTELTAAAKKAAGKLTVVDSKRTTQSAAPDMNDFDAAWKEASAAG